jgi:hypothetical protein
MTPEDKKKSGVQLTNEDIKKFFSRGNSSIKQMDPKALRNLWNRGSDDETTEQKVLRIRTQVASNELKKDRKEKLKEYQGLYFKNLYYEDLQVLSNLPYFTWRQQTKKFKNENFRKKVNKGKSINADSIRRIEYLLNINLNISDSSKNLGFRVNIKNVNLFKTFSELELIKKLKTVELMNQGTYHKYEAFLNDIRSYIYFIFSKGMATYEP